MCIDALLNGKLMNQPRRSGGWQAEYICPLPPHAHQCGQMPRCALFLLGLAHG